MICTVQSLYRTALHRPVYTVLSQLSVLIAGTCATSQHNRAFIINSGDGAYRLPLPPVRSTLRMSEYSSLPPLQRYCLDALVWHLPRWHVHGLPPLAPQHASAVLSRALEWYCPGNGIPDALPAHELFAAVRRTSLPTLDLLAVSANDTAHICTALLTTLVMHEFETVRFSSSHVAAGQARARALLCELVTGRTAPFVRKLTIRGTGASGGMETSRAMREEVLLPFADALVDLKRLELSHLPAVDDHVVSMLMRCAPNLERLQVSFCSLSGAGLSAILTNTRGFCPPRSSLRSLDLSGCDVDATSLLCLVGMTQLEELVLGWTPAIKPRGALGDDAHVDAEVTLSCVVADLPKLRLLDLSSACLNLAMIFAAIGSMQHGEIILASSLMRPTLCSDYGLRLPLHLRVLNLGGTIGLTLKALMEATLDGRLERLEKLCLADSDFSANAGCGGKDPLQMLKDTFRNLPACTMLDLSGLNVSAHELGVVMSHCSPRLQVLRLARSRISIVTYITLQEYQCSGFSLLRELDLSETKPDIKTMNLFLSWMAPHERLDAHDVQDSFVQSVRTLPIPTPLDMAAGLGKEHPSRKAHGLKVLRLRSCSVTDETIAVACRSGLIGGGLESLDLSLTNISDRTLDTLADVSYPLWTLLDVRGCQFITHAGVARLAASVPTLRTLRSDCEPCLLPAWFAAAHENATRLGIEPQYAPVYYGSGKPNAERHRYSAEELLAKSALQGKGDSDMIRMCIGSADIRGRGIFKNL